MSPLPAAFFELGIAPLASVLALRHAARAFGPRRAGVEFGALLLYGYALERVTIAVFDSHEYGTGWLFAPGGVPVAVAACWAAIILSSVGAALRLGAGSAGALAATAALVGVRLDLLMEPVAVRSELWSWTPPGPWLGVPIGNFVGWGVIVGGSVLGAQRLADSGSASLDAAGRLALGGVSILALVLVGLAWTRLEAERLFGSGRGFLVAGFLLLGLWALSRRAPRERMQAPGFGGRLGGAGRPLALVPIALAFAANAFLLADATLAVLSASVALMLLRVLAK